MRKSDIAILLSGVIFFAGCGGEGGALKAKIENGKKTYRVYCQSCHMDDGGGVPGMNAPLIGSKYAAGNKEELISIILHGSAAFTNDTERTYQNKMPSLANLTDQEIADVLTYIRNSFKNKGPLIEAADVKQEREKKN